MAHGISAFKLLVFNIPSGHACLAPRQQGRTGTHNPEYIGGCSHMRHVQGNHYYFISVFLGLSGKEPELWEGPGEETEE